MSMFLLVASMVITQADAPPCPCPLCPGAEKRFDASFLRSYLELWDNGLIRYSEERTSKDPNLYHAYDWVRPAEHICKTCSASAGRPIVHPPGWKKHQLSLKSEPSEVVISDESDPTIYADEDPADLPSYAVATSAINVPKHALYSAQHPELRYGGRKNPRWHGDIEGKTPLEREIDFYQKLQSFAGSDNLRQGGKLFGAPRSKGENYTIATYPKWVYYRVIEMKNQTRYQLYVRPGIRAPKVVYGS